MLITSALFTSMLAAASAGPVDPSHLQIVPCEFDDTYQYTFPSCEIELKNTGDVPIHISSIAATTEGDSIAAKQIVVPAKGAAQFSVSVAVRDDVGISKHIFKLRTDEPGQPIRYAEAKGFVNNILDVPNPELDYGVVDLLKDLPELSVELTSREVENFLVERIISAPPYIEAKLSSDRRTLEARVKRDAPWGVYGKDRIILETNSSHQRRVSVRVKADFHGEIVPASNPFSLGYMRTNSKNEYLIRLSSRTGRAFDVGAIDLEGFKGSAAVVPCQVARKDCKQIRLLVSSDQATGVLSGVLRLNLAEYGKSIPIYVWGMLLKPETKIVDLAEEMEKTNSLKDASDGNSPPRNVDIKSVLRDSVRPRPVAEDPPPGNGPLVKWTVANEDLLYGYLIYRSESEAGPFLRANKNIIHVHDQFGKGLPYQWRDESVVSGRTYWYYVGTISRSGEKAQLTTAQKVVAK